MGSDHTPLQQNKDDVLEECDKPTGMSSDLMTASANVFS